MNESQIGKDLQETETTDKTEQIKRYKSIKTKSYVNRNFNDPNSLDLNSMNHEQLLIEATRLQSHVTQLKNLLEKATKNETIAQTATTSDSSDKKKKYKERPFNFDNYNKRHVFVKFAYLGW